MILIIKMYSATKLINRLILVLIFLSQVSIKYIEKCNVNVSKPAIQYYVNYTLCTFSQKANPKICPTQSYGKVLFILILG